jgi:LPS O-antigen subunit length determinant protein (WzzB/FepE family)
VYPFASHILFGMIGGLLGALIVLGVRRLSQKADK